MTTTYTNLMRLAKPDFRDPGWGSLIDGNMDAIDAVVQALYGAANFVIWANNTPFTVGKVAIDESVNPPTYWLCNVPHTSAIGPTTFAQDRAAHPTFWSIFMSSLITGHH